VVDGRLVIAGNQELVALGARPPKKEKSPANKLDEQRVASTSSSLSP
jgi:hypothetical protein